MLRGDRILTLVLLAATSAAAVSAQQWDFGARLFPTIVGIPTALCAVALLVVGGRGASSARRLEVMDVAVMDDQPPAQVVRRAVATFAWILGLAAGVWVVGFIVAVPAFVFAYLMLQGRERWTTALALTVVTEAFLLGVFDQLLHVFWPPGLLQHWLGL